MSASEASRASAHAVDAADAADAAAQRTPAWVTRLVWCALALGAIGVLLLARWLEPDPRGFGTHAQLGLPPCGFAALTGLGCPSCGLTTSFAHMARAQLTSALQAHALGPALFVLVGASVPLALAACARAWPIAATLRSLRAQPLAVIIAVAALAYWVVRSISQAG